MNMRKFGFGSLALALGILTACGGDDGGGTGDGTTGDGTSTGTPMMTTASMTTASMTTASMDDTSTGEPPPGTTDDGDTSTGEPPADSSGSGSGSGEDSGSSESGTGGGGGLDCKNPADDCQMCVCDECPKEAAACNADPGCIAIRDCAAENNCTGLDCLGPCGDVINANGGVAGDSAMLAGALGACVAPACSMPGDPCAP